MATVDYFLKIDGIKGESQDDKHKGEIDILSFSWGETNSGSMAGLGGGGSGKVTMQDFNFVMTVSDASPKLMLACASGQHIKEATLTCRRAGKNQQEFLKIKLSELIVSSYHIGGSEASGVIPLDNVSLNYTKINFEYKEQKPDGTLGGAITAGWDLKANKEIA